MTILNQMSVVMAGLIRTGAVLRFVYCMIRLQSAEQERDMYIKRSKNTVFFLILAECAWVLKELALYYYN